MANELNYGRPRICTLLVCGFYAFSWSACSGDQKVDADVAPSNDAVADEDGATSSIDGVNDGGGGNGANSGGGSKDEEPKNGNLTANNGGGQNPAGEDSPLNAKNGNAPANGGLGLGNGQAPANAPANASANAPANAAPLNAAPLNAAPLNAAAPANALANSAPAAEPPLDQAPPPALEPAGAPAAPNANAGNNANSAGEAAPATGPVAAAPPLRNGPLLQAPLLKADLVPALAKLFWVGYDYLEKESMVRIEMVTRGSPKYNVFQERNQLNQPELVVRFFNTELRHKLRRDIDATEFRSPVAFVRLRPDSEEHTVDVVMTMRDEVQPRLYNKYGNIMLTFAIPDRYFGNNGIGSAPVMQAQLLPNANLMPIVDGDSNPSEGAKLAKAFVNDPGKDAFAGAPAAAGAPVQPGQAPANAPQGPGQPGLVPAGGLPPDFSNQPVAAPATLVPTPAAPAGGVAAPPPGVPVLPPSNSLSNDLYEDPNKPREPQPAAGADDFDSRGVGNGATPLPPLSAPAKGSEKKDREQLDNSKFDDFDDGKGESDSDIDKFDVRVRPAAHGGGLYDIAVFTSAGVAADDGAANAPAGGSDADLFGDGGGDVAAAPAAASNGAPASGGTADAEALLGDAAAAPAAATNAAAAAPANAAAASSAAATPGANPAVGAGPANAAAAPAAAVAAPMAAPAALAPAPAQLAAPASDIPPGEPPLEGSPDLAGQESEGAATDQGGAPGSNGGRPMKVDFRGAPLTEVIRVLSDESHVNFILPPELGDKKIFISLNGVPFNDALKAILDANALQMVPQAPNLVRIDTIEHFAAEKEAEERRRKAELKLRPTKILVHRLSYAKVEDAAKMLGEMLGGAAKDDKRIAVQIDVRTNSVIVNAPPGDLATVKALLERIDLETPQVKIASRIVEVIKTFNDDFGIKWGTPFNFDQGRGLGFGNLVFPNYMLSRYSVDAGGGAPSTGNTVFHFGSVNNSTAVDLALAMQESSGTTEVLQSGNLIVEDNHEAVIVAGSSEFFRPVAQQGAVSAAGSLDEIKYNLSVKVTPHITADGAVQMALNIESDTAAQATTQGAAASKNNRSINTSLLRRSGETAVIGGIYNTSHDKTQHGVPFLSSLPIVGALFRQSSTKDQKRELMVMVTPTILTNSKAFAASAGDAGIPTGAPAAAVAPAPANSSGNLSSGGASNNAGGGNSNFDGSGSGGNAGGNSGGNAGGNSGGNAGGNSGGNGAGNASAGGNANSGDSANSGGGGDGGNGGGGNNAPAVEASDGNGGGGGGNFGGGANGGNVGNEALTNAKDNGGGNGGGGNGGE